MTLLVAMFAKQSAGMQKINNYLREYNTQLSRFVFYLNCHMAANLSKSSISGELDAVK